MSRFALALLLLGATACTNSPQASEAAATPDANSPKPASVEAKTVCTQQNDTRLIEVKPKGDGSCDLLYTKFGTEKAVASGSNAFCEKVRHQIKTQLTRSGFSCE